MIGCLMLHGFTGRLEEINPLVKYLKEQTNWKIVAPVLPGHGDELNLKGKKYSMWLNKAKEALLDLKKHCETVFVIGFSMGAMISVQLAAEISIDRLVLLAPAANVLPVGRMVSELRKMLKDSKRGKLESNIMYQHSVQKIVYTPLSSVFELLKLIKRSKKNIYEIDIPILIIQGKQDALVPYKKICRFDKEIQSKEKNIVLVQEAGHFLCLEKDTKHIVNTLTLQFLKSTKLKMNSR